MTDQAVLTEVQRTMLEPANGGTSWRSQLWTGPEVLGYLNLRQNQFLKESLIIATVASIGVPALTAVLDLPSDWMATIHVAWRTLAGRVTPVFRSDQVTVDYGYVDWMRTPAVPLTWADAERVPPAMHLMPSPLADGFLELIYVSSAPPLTGAGDTLLVPDDFCLFVRYGVLADMLSKEGRGQDLNRAAACEQRFAEGVDLGQGLLKGWAG